MFPCKLTSDSTTQSSFFSGNLMFIAPATAPIDAWKQEAYPEPNNASGFVPPSLCEPGMLKLMSRPSLCMCPLFGPLTLLMVDARRGRGLASEKRLDVEGCIFGFKLKFAVLRARMR